MKNEEDIIQINFFNMVRQLNIKELALIHHIPNGGKRNLREAVKFKRLGVLSGVADVFLPLARQSFNGFYIEFKAIKGVQSKAQKEFENQVKANGYKYIVCRDAMTAINEVLKYVKTVN